MAAQVAVGLIAALIGGLTSLSLGPDTQNVVTPVAYAWTASHIATSLYSYVNIDTPLEPPQDNGTYTSSNNTVQAEPEIVYIPTRTSKLINAIPSTTTTDEDTPVEDGESDEVYDGLLKACMYGLLSVMVITSCLRLVWTARVGETKKLVPDTDKQQEASKAPAKCTDGPSTSENAHSSLDPPKQQEASKPPAECSNAPSTSEKAQSSLDPPKLPKDLDAARKEIDSLRAELAESHEQRKRLQADLANDSYIERGRLRRQSSNLRLSRSAPPSRDILEGPPSTDDAVATVGDAMPESAVPTLNSVPMVDLFFEDLNSLLDLYDTARQDVSDAVEAHTKDRKLSKDRFEPAFEGALRNMLNQFHPMTDFRGRSSRSLTQAVQDLTEQALDGAKLKALYQDKKHRSSGRDHADCEKQRKELEKQTDELLTKLLDAVSGDFQATSLLWSDMQVNLLHLPTSMGITTRAPLDGLAVAAGKPRPAVCLPGAARATDVGTSDSKTAGGMATNPKTTGSSATGIGAKPSSATGLMASMWA